MGHSTFLCTLLNVFRYSFQFSSWQQRPNWDSRQLQACYSRTSSPALRISREVSFPENRMIRGHSKDSVQSSCRGPNLPFFNFQNRLLEFSSLARLLSSYQTGDTSPKVPEANSRAKACTLALLKHSLNINTAFGTSRSVRTMLS
jgi:hypothetical protein